MQKALKTALKWIGVIRKPFSVYLDAVLSTSCTDPKIAMENVKKINVEAGEQRLGSKRSEA